MNRTIAKILCTTCGSMMHEQEITEAEHEAFGCGTKGCCAQVWKCPSCSRARILIAFEAPEAFRD